jgi:FMNH2-dependent dimethyl sulfone monooxygenase
MDQVTSHKAARGPLQLGVFMPNCSYAYSISTYKPEPDDWTYESNLRISEAAERSGFDLLFPVAKWRGFGGKTNYLGTSLETMTWASAILAQTKRIKVFSTVHVPLFHPLVVAKMGATLDHIGKGRWGLNVVSGWSEREFSQTNIEVLPHADRYKRTEAYVEIVKGPVDRTARDLQLQLALVQDHRRLHQSAAGQPPSSAVG